MEKKQHEEGLWRFIWIFFLRLTSVIFPLDTSFARAFDRELSILKVGTRGVEYKRCDELAKDRRRRKR